MDRVTKAAASMGLPASRYTSLNPILAGYLLVDDFPPSVGMTQDAVLQDVAQPQKLPLRR